MNWRRPVRGLLIGITAAAVGCGVSWFAEIRIHGDGAGGGSSARTTSAPPHRGTTSSGTSIDNVTITADIVPFSDRSWMLGLPRPLANTSPPAGLDCPQLFSWARRQGAVSTEFTRVAIRVTTNRMMSIELTSVYGRIIRQTGHQSGLVDITCQPENQRETSSSVWNDEPSLDLGTTDESEFVWQSGQRIVRPGSPGTWQFDLSMVGSADTYYVLELDYRRDGVPYRRTIDNQGKPFLLAARGDGAGFAPPAYSFTRRPYPHFSFTPAQCDGRPCR